MARSRRKAPALPAGGQVVRVGQVDVDPLVDAAIRYAQAGRAPSTWRAYDRDWRAFIAYCKTHGARSLPADDNTVANFLAHGAGSGRKVSTLLRQLAAIAEAHRIAGHPSPRATAPVRHVLGGIRRTHGVAPRQVEPITVDELRRLVAAQPERLRGLRNRALLLVGFAGGFRRSELVELDVADLAFVDEGCRVNVRRSKTDQEGAGRLVGLPYGSDVLTCPVRTLRRWLEAAAIAEGPVFRPVDRHDKLRAPCPRRDGEPRLSGRAVAEVVKGAAAACGLPPERYSGHSLRAGLCTAAALAGKAERIIMAQTGHRAAVTLRRYIRRGELFRDNAASGIGL